MNLFCICFSLSYFRTVEEKSSWLDALCLAIEELYKRKSSFKIGTECSSPVDLQKPPLYIKMDGVQKCMDCGANFGVMKRKHHCRACGSVRSSPFPCLYHYHPNIFNQIPHLNSQTIASVFSWRSLYYWLISWSMILRILLDFIWSICLVY